MAALAERPNHIKEMFLTKDDNQAGIYAVRFYILGKPWTVTIDDYLPFTRENPWSDPTLIFAMGDRNMKMNQTALWGIIIEKAWAKVKGSYSNSNIGFTQNGLRAFLGVPVFDFKSIDINAD
jgi:calpain-15